MQSNPVFLYVEDEPFSRTIMEMLMVRGLGYKNFTMFEDSQQFLERLDRLNPQPNIIFLDIHMKPYTGIEMLAMLRQTPQYHATRVIALTASVMNEEVDELKKAGFNGAISKPIDQTTFPDLLMRVLKGEEIWHIT